MRTIRLLLDPHPDPPALDTAISRATLEGVARGSLPETLRLHRPGDVLAFGPRDRVAPGFADAVAAARAHGFSPVERLAGGRAAVFHGGTIALSWAMPANDLRGGIRERFEEVSALLAQAFTSLGVDARVGEVPGEYCPGEHSVNAGGRTKVAGVGQRIVAGAVHVGGVIVVEGSDRIRDVLVPVYRALEIPWRPETTGSLRGEVSGITWQAACEAIVSAFGGPFDLDGSPSTPAEVLTRARDLMSRHDLSPEKE
ncbi:MAG TPA: lipoate--protein ligase family protein [Actinomycetota bacterium]